MLNTINKKNLGGWALDYEVIKYLSTVLPERATIIELGSGTGSYELSKIWDIITVEHNIHFLHKYPTVEYVYAPIINNWYDVDILLSLLPAQYDCLIIDGPPGDIGRQGVVDNFMQIFNKERMIIIDDINRAEDMKVMLDLEVLLDKKGIIFDNGEKHFGVIL